MFKNQKTSSKPPLMTLKPSKFICGACKTAVDTGNFDGFVGSDDVFDSISNNYWSTMRPLYGAITYTPNGWHNRDMDREHLESGCSLCFSGKDDKKPALDIVYEISQADFTGPIGLVRKDSDENDSPWFSPDTMSFFNTELDLFCLDGFFVTSEQPNPGFTGPPRKYTVRRYLGMGETKTVGEFHQIADRKGAYRCLVEHLLVSVALWSSEAFEPFTGMDFEEQISHVYDGRSASDLAYALVDGLHVEHRKGVRVKGHAALSNYFQRICLLEETLEDVLKRHDHFSRLPSLPAEHDEFSGPDPVHNLGGDH